MLQILKRIVQGKTVYGYMMTDGHQIQLVDKETVCAWAKQGEILNVIATGDRNTSSISGTNGFKLKELEDVSFETALMFMYASGNK